jgi:hypothetical protein
MKTASGCSCDEVPPNLFVGRVGITDRTNPDHILPARADAAVMAAAGAVDILNEDTPNLTGQLRLRAAWSQTTLVTATFV